MKKEIPIINLDKPIKNGIFKLKCKSGKENLATIFTVDDNFLIKLKTIICQMPNSLEKLQIESLYNELNKEKQNEKTSKIS